MRDQVHLLTHRPDLVWVAPGLCVLDCLAQLGETGTIGAAGLIVQEHTGVPRGNSPGRGSVACRPEAFEIQAGVGTPRLGEEAGEHAQSLAVSQPQHTSVVADGPVLPLEAQRPRLNRAAIRVCRKRPRVLPLGWLLLSSSADADRRSRGRATEAG